MSGNLIDVANFAVQQAPASTRFLTNKMCPFAQKVWIALEVIGAPYEMEEVALYGANGKPDWFWDLNPDGTVPVLVCHGGAVVLPDSELALDQIETGSAIPGANNNHRLMMIADDGNDKLGTTTTTKSMVQEWRSSMIPKQLLPIGKQAVLAGRNGKQQQRKLQQVLKDMDAKVVGPYLCGDQITTADCAAFPFLWRLNDEFGLEEYNNLNTWLQTCLKHKAFSKTVQSSWWWWW